jgi:hypothetical protein
MYALDVRAGRIERWTTSEIGGANPESLPDAELIEWKSFDERIIPGLRIARLLDSPVRDR